MFYIHIFIFHVYTFLYALRSRFAHIHSYIHSLKDQPWPQRITDGGFQTPGFGGQDDDTGDGHRRGTGPWDGVRDDKFLPRWWFHIFFKFYPYLGR